MLNCTSCGPRLPALPSVYSSPVCLTARCLPSTAQLGSVMTTHPAVDGPGCCNKLSLSLCTPGQPLACCHALLVKLQLELVFAASKKAQDMAPSLQTCWQRCRLQRGTCLPSLGTKHASLDANLALCRGLRLREGCTLCPHQSEGKGAATIKGFQLHDILWRECIPVTTKIQPRWYGRGILDRK